MASKKFQQKSMKKHGIWQKYKSSNDHQFEKDIYSNFENNIFLIFFSKLNHPQKKCRRG